MAVDPDPSWPRLRTAADSPTVLTSADRRSALHDMIALGGFTDTPALARWAATAEAEPVLRRYLVLRMQPMAAEPFTIDLAACEWEDAEMAALAADIEARFG